MRPSPADPARRMRPAAAIQLGHGLLVEGLPFLGLIVLLVLGIDQDVVTARAHVFALPYLQENLYLMMAISGVFAALRVTASIGLLRDRIWGLALTLINCVVTLVLMIFLLPTGIVDGVLSGTTLILILSGWYGSARISAGSLP